MTNECQIVNNELELLVAKRPLWAQQPGQELGGIVEDTVVLIDDRVFFIFVIE
jgi:hypothetical protein